MCFSPLASFTAAGVLAVAGVASVPKAKTRAEKLFACTPLLFAVQQFIEGLQWQAINAGGANLLLGYAFLFFAFLIWPTYIPLTVFLLEKDKGRKDLLKYFLLLGYAVSGYLLLSLIFIPLTVTDAGHSIAYNIAVPFRDQLFIFYVIAVCGSALLSSFRWVRVFGLTSFVSLVTALIVFNYTAASVWCFFSAILSVIVYLHLVSKSKK